MNQSVSAFDGDAAVNVFRQLTDQLGISDYVIDGWGGEIRLRHVLEPYGWLGPLMLHADELSAALYGQRIWNVGYQANREAVEGVLPIPVESIDDPDVRGYYEAVPHCGEPGPSFTLFNQLALTRKLALDPANQCVALHPISGQYPNERPLEDGECLAFPTPDMALSVFWQELVVDASLAPAMRQAITGEPVERKQYVE